MATYFCLHCNSLFANAPIMASECRCGGRIVLIERSDLALAAH